MESKDFSAKRFQRKIIVDQKRRRKGNNDRPPFTPIENDSRIPGVIRPMHLTQQARASGNMFDPGKENFKPMSSSCVTQSTATPGIQLNNLNIWNKFTNTCNAPPNLYLTPQTPIIDYSSGVCSALTYQRTTGTVNPRPSINVSNPLDTEHVPTRRGKHIIQSSTVLQSVQRNLHTNNCPTNINPQLRYMRSTSKTTEHSTRSHSTISMGDCGSFFSPFQSSIPVEDSNTHSQYCHGESSSRQVVNEDIGSDNKHGGNMFDPGKENFKPMSSSCVTQSTATPGIQLNNLNIWNKFTNTCNAPPNLYLTPQTPIIDYSSGVCSALTYQRTTGTVNPRPSINVSNPLDTEHVPTRRGKHIIQSSTVLQSVQRNLHTNNCPTNINPQLRYMRSTSKTTEHSTRSHSTISMGDCGSFFSPFQSSIPVEDSNTHSQYCHGESSSRQVVNEDIGSDNKHGDDIVDENDNHIQGEYWDMGDPEFECQYCGAQMWYGERLKKARRQKNPKFGLCCGQGKGVDNDFDPTLVNALKNMIDVYNPIARSFRMAADRIQQGDCSNVKLRLIGRRSKDGRQYNLPTSSEVAAIIIGDINPDYDQRDIVVDEKSKGLQRINEYHPSYLALKIIFNSFCSRIFDSNQIFII
ncbi:hypothetical protein OROGR_010023 [Orobanche gracilis]